MISLLVNYTYAYSDNLVTVTLFPCPNTVTVSNRLCIYKHSVCCNCAAERDKEKPVDLNSIHEYDFHLILGPINNSRHLDTYMMLGKVTLEQQEAALKHFQ